MSKNIYNIPVRTNDGTETTLAEHEGKVLLVVNVASKCGLTPQYEGLESLYQQYKDQGVEVLGFPANNFLAQEPGTDEEILEFCQTNYNVSFPIYQKISAHGDDRHELYNYLTEQKGAPDITNGDEFEEKLKGYGQTRTNPTDILWNFEKFLIGKNGEVAARISPDVVAEDARVVEKVKAELAK